MGDPWYWSCNEVSTWLKDRGFQNYCQLLCEEHQIDGQGLLNLTESDIKEPPIGIRVVGDVKRLIQCIKTLKLQSNGRRNGIISTNTNLSQVPAETILQIGENDIHSTQELSDLQKVCNRLPHKNKQISRNGEPERQKALIGLVYMLLGLYCTCFSIVVVQAKAPDQHKHPPLPDVFLDHFPEISWAYKVTDTVLISLMMSWAIIVILHKHR